MNAVPEPDRIDGVKHPNETSTVFGHDPIKAKFLKAFNRGRLHHAWMLTGPKGIGKATLAYNIAQFLLTQEPSADQPFGQEVPKSKLEIPKGNPVSSRIRAGSEPGLFVLRRPLDEKTAKLKNVITVETVRELRNFFSLSTTGNGYRIVIVDCVDDMNNNAANALLKLLEEPPKKSVLILVTHQPSKILPTIRSRCQKLACAPLSKMDLQSAFEAALPGTPFDKRFATLSLGSVGRALQLALSEGIETYTKIIDLCVNLPKLDRTKLLTLANSYNRTAEDKFDQLQVLVDIFLARMALSPFNHSSDDHAISGEREVFLRLCPDQYASHQWAKTQLEVSQTARKSIEANLDPSSLILDMGFKIEATATKILN
jgi:DNA polymerase-3 subunit delta'